jgi:Zn-dependent protease with chaperone function
VITKTPPQVSGGGLKEDRFREAVEQPERTSKTSAITDPHVLSDEKVTTKIKTIDTQSRTKKSNDTDQSSGLMLRPDAGLLSLMPIAEMKIKAGIAIWTMLTAMMIIVYDLREAMGIYHAAMAIMIALAIYGVGTFTFLNHQREWITSDHKDKRKLRILQRMRTTAVKAGLAVPQIALAEDDPDVNVVTYGMSTDTAKVVVTGPFMEHVKPSDEELDAVFAHELSHIRHGDFIISTLLRFPLWLLHKILHLIQILRWIGTHCFAIFAQIAGALGIIGLFMIFAGVVVLFYLSVTAAIVGAAILICTLSLSAFEREREYLADMYSARLLGSARPVQSVLAKLKQAGERVQKELDKRAEVAQEGDQIDMNVEAPADAFISDGIVAKALQQKPGMMQAFMRGEFFMSHPITEHRIFYLENPMERMRFFSNLWNKIVVKANKRLGAVPKTSSTLKTVILSSLSFLDLAQNATNGQANSLLPP